MILRRDVLIITGIIFIMLFIVIYTISTNQILSSFSDLEKKYALENVNRSINALNDEILKLDNICYDWAAWDDTYEFVDNPTQEYIDSNLVDSTFTALHLNFIVYVNRSGYIVYAKAYDLRKNQRMPLPEGLLDHIDFLSTFNETPELGKLTKRGIISIDGEAAIVSSRPILTSEDEGPINGALIMGRFLDKEEIRALSESVGLKLSLIPASTHLDKIKLVPVNESVIVGYALLKDVYGKPAYILSVEMSRDIYMHGLKTVRLFILSITAVGILFSIVTIVFIDRSVLSRISMLSESVSKIRESGNLKERVPVNGSDELAKLGTEINGMLERIENLNEQLKVLNRILRHDMLNNLTVIKAALESVEPRNDSDKSLLKHAVNSVDKSVELIRDVRELESAITSGTDLKPVNIREAIENVAKNYPNVKFNISGECKCLADKAIQSVFDNIINNAIIHGKTDRIDITIRDVGDFCEVRIADYGKGVPEEIKDKIFEEGFKYGESARTGLGLYIVKKVLERYGGSVAVEDNKPCGAVFVLKFKKC